MIHWGMRKVIPNSIYKPKKDGRGKESEISSQPFSHLDHFLIVVILSRYHRDISEARSRIVLGGAL